MPQFSHSRQRALALAVVLAAAACTSLDTPKPSGLCDKSVALAIADTVRDTLTTTDCKLSDGTYIDYFSFGLGEQQSLRFALSSPSNQAIMMLLDGRGAIIANSYLQHGADTTATLRTMLDSGTYTLAVRGVNAGGTGPYLMSVTNDTTPVGGCSWVWLTPGDSTAQTIRASDCTTGPGGSSYFYHVYAIVLIQNQIIDITEHSTAFDPQAYLVGTNGTTASVVDSTGHNAVISYTNATQGALQLWVGSSAAGSLGQYSLTLR